MPANKTQATEASVQGFLADVKNKRRQDDARNLLDLMENLTGAGGCLYINKLDDVDLEVLKSMILAAYTKPSAVEA